MAEIQFSPTVRPPAFEVNVPGTTPDLGPLSAEDDGNYLKQHLLLTRERILKLQGAFRGLEPPPRTGETSGADRRGPIGSRVDLDFHTRLITASAERDASDSEVRGLSINFLV